MSDEKDAPKGKCKSKKANTAKPKKSSVVVKLDDGKRAAKRASLARTKLTEAMKDPEMRDQLVQAIRAMIREGRE